MITLLFSNGNNSLLVNNKTKVNNFEVAAEFIVSELRFSHVVRKTKETDISSYSFLG